LCELPNCLLGRDHEEKRREEKRREEGREEKERREEKRDVRIGLDPKRRSREETSK